MEFESTEIQDLFVIHLKMIGDDRGWFMRTFSEDVFRENIPGFKCKWVQMNHSFNAEKGTWRGLHYQKPPYQETKVVRCISGALIDYVVDLRKNSPTFLNSYTVELSAENKKMLYIPKGFAHGFLTIENNTELVYLHDEFYTQECEVGLRYDDTLIQLELASPIIHISEKDKNHKLLNKEFKGY